MASPQLDHDGFRELRGARGLAWHLFLTVGLFSVAVNLLMLTGPIFMLQVYDRVLSSRSVETLVALTGLMTFLFVLMGVIDLARNRIMVRVAAQFQNRMEARVFAASLQEGQGRGGLRDLDAVRQLIAAPALMAGFDLPWAPLFMVAVFVFHPLLGVVALAGMIVLVVATVLNQLMARHPLREATLAGQAANRSSDLYAQAGEVIGALGMRAATLRRWQVARHRATGAAMQGGDRAAAFTVFSRSFRLFLQSALLATGAWLVLRHEITPGAMIAASILMGRSLAPVEQLVASWPLVQRALDGWRRLGELLGRRPPQAVPTALPRPDASLDVNQLAILPPDGQGGQGPVLRGISFQLKPGQGLGVIGPSGSGKSTLARALIGALPPAGGSVRLGGASLDQYDPDVLGRLVGYLPQQVTLFDGTIAENIARLGHPDPARVVAAAEAAAAHAMILNLPQGYDTMVSQAGGRLSGGQIQRIGLARALYGEPVLFVLDEPNASLDNEGSDALNQAIRSIKARGGAVVVMTHRPAAINECDLLMMLDGGCSRAFGPRDEVLRAMVRNGAQIQRPRRHAGGAV